MIFKSPHPPVTIPNVSLGELLLTRAEGFGDKPALIDGVNGNTYTFKELTGAVRRVAGGLTASGFTKGDVLLLMSPNCIEFAITFLASVMLGGISTTLNPTASSLELTSQASDSGADYLFTTPELFRRSHIRTARRWKQTIVLGNNEGTLPFDTLLKSSLQPPLTRIVPTEDLAALPYSSGTTGVSKGVMLTHQNLVANLRQIASGIFTEEDTILGLPPFFHIYGLTVVLLLGLYLGATNVVLPRFDVALFSDAVERYQVSHANLVPPLLVTLAKHAGIEPDKLSSLKTVQSGAAPLSSETAQAFSERFGCRIFQSYGLTETSPVTHYVPRTSIDIPVQSVGPSAPGTECRIVDLDSGRALGPDRRGELYVRGPQVMHGYLNDPEKTAGMIDEDGWLRTGDIVYVDEHGNFFVVDRAKELIKYRAYPIAPAELEAILLGHPSITDAAVVGVPDTTAGEIPKAFVVAEPSLEAKALMAWMAERVSPHKRIRKVEFVQEIPKSPSGKILRRLLREKESLRS
jgi:acyl-CoA synthetase (AMP-forming)/AMP-acid ligase II